MSSWPTLWAVLSLAAICSAHEGAGAVVVGVEAAVRVVLVGFVVLLAVGEGVVPRVDVEAVLAVVPFAAGSCPRVQAAGMARARQAAVAPSTREVRCGR
jgi:hypothetical protein